MTSWERTPAAERITLGEWEFERRADEIADLAFAGRRVLRSLRCVVRDRDWNTAAWRILSSSAGAGGLSLTLRTDELGAAIDATLRVSVAASDLVIRFDAVSGADFATNRTGLVVLHPPHLAGSALQVTHADGSREGTRFPESISAHQPVLDIAALSWADGGLDVSVEFDGEVFEMEDQRNWTDASFKTYSRPLALPFPYRLGAGERVTQTITVRAGVTSGGARTSGGNQAIPGADRLDLRAGGAFPDVRLGASTAPDPEPAGIAPLGSALLVELDLTSSNWRAALARAAARGLPLDVRVVASADVTASLSELATRLRGLALAQIAVFDRALQVSEASLVTALRVALDQAGVSASVIGGTRSHFTELNREGFRLPADLDGIVVTGTPLFHSVDTEQLVEAVGMQRIVAAQTVGLANGRAVHLGPITLRPRFNNVATGPMPGPTLADLTEGYGAEFTGIADARQASPQLAAWAVASAAAFAVPGVESLSYFEEWGPRGVHTSSGDPYPVAEALTALAACAGGTLLWADSPDGLIWALGSRDAAGITLLVANLDTRAREITVALDTRSLSIAVERSSFVRRRL